MYKGVVAYLSPGYIDKNGEIVEAIFRTLFAKNVTFWCLVLTLCKLLIKINRKAFTAVFFDSNSAMYWLIERESNFRDLIEIGRRMSTKGYDWTFDKIIYYNGYLNEFQDVKLDLYSGKVILGFKVNLKKGIIYDYNLQESGVIYTKYYGDELKNFNTLKGLVAYLKTKGKKEVIK